ncbi:MAG: methyltransferase family protein [Methylophagaceae bacterium]
MLKLKIPPPIYALLIAGLMWLLDQRLPILGSSSSIWQQIGYLFIITALLFDLSAVVHFFRNHTTINPLRPQNSEKLVITAMYRYSRNPMYLGLLFLLIGWAFLLGSLLPFIMLPVFIVIMTRQQIIPEEQILEQKFGQQYRDYKNTVNRWL